MGQFKRGHKENMAIKILFAVLAIVEINNFVHNTFTNEACVLREMGWMDWDYNIMDFNFDYEITLLPAPVYAALESQFEPCQQETMSVMESDFDENCKMNYSQEALDQLTKNG